MHGLVSQATYFFSPLIHATLIHIHCYANIHHVYLRDYWTIRYVNDRMKTVLNPKERRKKSLRDPLAISLFILLQKCLVYFQMSVSFRFVFLIQYEFLFSSLSLRRSRIDIIPTREQDHAVHNYRAKYAPITQLLQRIDARFAEEKLYKCRVKYVTAIEEHLWYFFAVLEGDTESLVQVGSHVSTRRSPWSHQSPSMRGLSS